MLQAYVAYQCDQATKRLCVRAWLGGVWTPIGGVSARMLGGGPLLALLIACSSGRASPLPRHVRWLPMPACIPPASNTSTLQPVSVGEASYINLKWWRYGAASAPYVAYSDKGLGTDAGPVVVKKWA